MRISELLDSIHKEPFNNLYRCINTLGSVIAEHLLHIHQYAMPYHKDMFSVLSQAHSSFHL